nr:MULTISPECIES: transposase family protein [Streptomyces]
MAAIAEWAADAPPNVLARLGGPCREPDRGPVAPAEATVRRVLQRIDGDALDTAVGSWLAGRERAAGQEENAARAPAAPHDCAHRPLDHCLRGVGARLVVAGQPA